MSRRSRRPDPSFEQFKTPALSGRFSLRLMQIKVEPLSDTHEY
jgi:hypothetical protein